MLYFVYLMLFSWPIFHYCYDSIHAVAIFWNVVYKQGNISSSCNSVLIHSLIHFEMEGSGAQRHLCLIQTLYTITLN